MQKTISILGCGWVGQALKKKLDTTYTVHCLSRSMQENEKNDVYNCDTLLIAIPPRENYLEVLTKTLAKINPETQVIFLSSTSFYDGKTLVVQGETLIQELHKTVLILRLSGLMGYKRIAGRYSAGKTKAHDARVNYVHRDDVVQIIKLCIEREERSNIFNVTAPMHPKQSEVFRQNAKKFSWEESYFESDKVLGKLVSSEKLVAYFQYEFLKPNPLEFWT
ncbi:MAG: Unknown protein [uncultured Sulfurovum sp.]|uniref:Pyrroline-5-carboxylate reductase catalytic N-terminal domain-containing protein n=1 Tax=uncultured Sulfurovum sp. TaxID=269237 RepID=A0A6S6T6X5_9BACT|nr:MAG: Unknown protein [uncultured Sulfurovum sp.]